MPKGNRTRNGVRKEEIVLKRAGCRNSKLSKWRSNPMWLVTNQAMDESFSLQHRWVFVATVFHAQIVSGLQWIHPIGPKAFRYSIENWYLGPEGIGCIRLVWVCAPKGLLECQIWGEFRWCFSISKKTSHPVRFAIEKGVGLSLQLWCPLTRITIRLQTNCVLVSQFRRSPGYKMAAFAEVVVDAFNWWSDFLRHKSTWKMFF